MLFIFLFKNAIQVHHWVFQLSFVRVPTAMSHIRYAQKPYNMYGVSLAPRTNPVANPSNNITFQSLTNYIL